MPEIDRVGGFSVDSRRAFGILVIVVAAARTVAASVKAIYVTEIAYAVVIAVLGIVVLLVYYWLWRLSNKTSGERMLLWAFLVSAGAALFSNLAGVIMTCVSMPAGTIIMFAADAGSVIAPLLLGGGLLKSRIVAPYVGWLALAWGVVGLVNLVPGTTLGAVFFWTGMVVFWLLGISLVVQDGPSERMA